MECSRCYRLVQNVSVLSEEIDPVFDDTTKHILIAASVILFLLYIAGLVFSLNSHYRLIEAEELLMKQEREQSVGSKPAGYSTKDISRWSTENYELKDKELSVGIPVMTDDHEDGKVNQSTVNNMQHGSKEDTDWDTKVVMRNFLCCSISIEKI